jgi:hypothetical protein
VVVDENVTVDLNPETPTCNDGTTSDLCGFFTWDKSDADPSNWKAIFDVGAKKLLVKNGATITVVKADPDGGSNRRSPGIEIRSTCELEIENGGAVVVNSLNRQAGDILIQVDGNIVINGTVRNEVSGTNGMPGDITIATLCGDIIVGSTGLVETLGIDPGGSDINLLACCDGGDIFINGLVMARAHAHETPYTEANRPNIRVAAFNGAVTINANTAEPLYDEYSLGGGNYDLWGGLLSWVTTNSMPGTVKVQALNDITVNGHGDDPTGAVRTSFGAIAASIKGASDTQGGTIDMRSLAGNITATDRAFDVSGRYNDNSLIRLWAAQNISLSRPGANATFNPVVDAHSTADKGGTNEIRAFQGGITIGTNALVSATGVPVATKNGTNLLTSCTGITNNGTVNPADLVPGDDSGVCDPATPEPLFNNLDLCPSCPCPPVETVCPVNTTTCPLVSTSCPALQHSVLH